MSSYDDIGPEVVMRVYDPATNLQAIIVLDSLLRGPAKGGIRMTDSVTKQEVCELARAMTLKNALANLPFGGGKSGIIADARSLSQEDKRLLVEAFAKKLSLIAPNHYIAAPDIAMDSEDMRVIASIAGNNSVTGKPVDIGGLSEKKASTGFGVFVAAREVLLLQDKELSSQRVAIQGFGNVGSFAAKYFSEADARVVAVSDSSATIIDPDGLDIASLIAFKDEGKRFSDYEDAKVGDVMDVLFVDCDVLVPAAQAEVITSDNQDDVCASVIVQAANLPIPHAVESVLEGRGVVVIPDILANSGGVIASHSEIVGHSSTEMFSAIEKTISENVSLLADSLIGSGSARSACIALAKKRLFSE